MESKHLLIGFIVYVVCNSGGTAFEDYNKKLENIAISEHQTTQQAKMVSVVKNAIALTEKTQSHIVYLAEKMHVEDTMSINDKKMTRAEVVKEYKTIETKEVYADEKFFIDGEYSVLGADVENHKISIRSDGMKKRQVSR